MNEYVSVADGVTRKQAEPGSRFDQRLDRSKRWRKVDKATSPRAARAPREPVEAEPAVADLDTGT